MGSGGGWASDSGRGGGEPPAPGDSNNPWSGAYDSDGFSNQPNPGDEQHIIKMRGVPFKVFALLVLWKYLDSILDKILFVNVLNVCLKLKFLSPKLAILVIVCVYAYDHI